jgi:hypothetical protein
MDEQTVTHRVGDRTKGVRDRIVELVRVRAG